MKITIAAASAPISGRVEQAREQRTARPAGRQAAADGWRWRRRLRESSWLLQGWVGPGRGGAGRPATRLRPGAGLAGVVRGVRAGSGRCWSCRRTTGRSAPACRRRGRCRWSGSATAIARPGSPARRAAGRPRTAILPSLIACAASGFRSKVAILAGAAGALLGLQRGQRDRRAEGHDVGDRRVLRPASAWMVCCTDGRSAPLTCRFSVFAKPCFTPAQRASSAHRPCAWITQSGLAAAVLCGQPLTDGLPGQRLVRAEVHHRRRPSCSRRCPR